MSFDPNYHGPEGIGVQQKAIRVTAGDIQEPLAEMRLTATIIDEPGQEGVPGSPQRVRMDRKGIIEDGAELRLRYQLASCRLGQAN